MKSLQLSGKRPAQMLLLGLAAIVLAVFSTSMVSADEFTDNEESYYDNPAQAAHASQLADEAALSDDDVQQAFDDYQEALDALGEEPTDEELAEVQALEETYQEALSAVTGVIEADIEAMRTSGMGWGDIAHELGVHPSTLGLGHKRGGMEFSEQELAEATARNTRNGLAKGHGLGVHGGVGSSNQGLGIDRGKGPDKSARGNISGTAGLSSGRDGASVGGKGGPGNSGGAGNANSNSNAGGNKGGNSGNAGGRGGDNAGGNAGGNADGNAGGGNAGGRGSDNAGGGNSGGKGRN